MNMCLILAWDIFGEYNLWKLQQILANLNFAEVSSENWPNDFAENWIVMNWREKN